MTQFGPRVITNMLDGSDDPQALSPLVPPERARRELSNGALAVFKLKPEGTQQAKDCLQRASKRTPSCDHW